MFEEVDDCPRCRGRRIVPGRLVGPNDVALAPAWFRFGIPDHPLVRPVWGVRRKMPIPAASQFCVDCGMIWTSVDPETARRIILDRGTDGLKRTLSPARKPSTVHDDLA